MTRSSLLGTVTRGLVVGAFGSFAQTLFFRATRALAPQTPRDAFDPPEAAQRDETATQTVARRLVEEFMQRGPLDEAGKERAGTLVHYAFGAAWGVDYTVGRELLPGLGSVAGTMLWSTFVWLASDGLLLPAFRLSAWPARYPMKAHAYAWAAHLAYGFAVWSAYETMRRAPAVVAAGGLGAAPLVSSVHATGDRAYAAVRAAAGRAPEELVTAV